MTASATPIATAANVPIEVAEAEFPIIVERYGLVPDSGGGRQIQRRSRAGEGLAATSADESAGSVGSATSRPLRAGRRTTRGTLGPISCTVQTARRCRFPRCSAIRSPAASSTTMCRQVAVDGAIRSTEILSGSLADVRNEKVSVEAARSQYGAVVAPGLRLDEAQTARLRAEMR